MTAYLLPFSEKSLSLHKQRRKTMPGSSTEAVALYPPSAGFFFRMRKIEQALNFDRMSGSRLEF